MNLSPEALACRVLLAAAGLSVFAAPAFAASIPSTARSAMSLETREQLKQAFTSAREFRPRGDRYQYQIGRADAEVAMRVADAVALTRAERLIAQDIHTYFVARDACRLAPTVSEYGTCEARVSDSFGDKILASLGDNPIR